MTTLTNHLARLANSANVLATAITVNSSAITSVNVGGTIINSSGFSGVANQATYANGSFTNTFTVGTASYFVANGNVGIGISSPTYKLEVNGIGRFVGSPLHIGTGASGSAAEILLNSGSDNNYADVDFAANSVTQWRIGKNGTNNWGIWTGAGSSNRFLISNTGDVNIGSTPTAAAGLRYFDVYNTESSNTNSGAIIRLVTANSSGGAGVSVDMVKYRFGGFYINNNDANGFINFGTAGTSNRLHITSGGNVGIGTDSPQRNLHVNGSIRFSSGGVIECGPTLNTYLAGISGGSGYWALATNDTERMRIDSAGRIATPYQPYCRVVSSAGTFSVVSGNQVIPYNSALSDIGSHFNTSTYRFTLPVTGKYLVTASIQLGSGSAQYYNLYLRMNGSGQFGTFQTGSGASYQQLSTTGVLYGNASDYIDVALFAVTASGSIEAAGDSRCSMSVTFLG